MTLNPDTLLAIPIVLIGLGAMYSGLRRRAAQGRPALGSSVRALRGTVVDAMVVSLLVWTFQFTVTVPAGTGHWSVLAGIAVVTVSGLVRAKLAAAEEHAPQQEDGAGPERAAGTPTLGR